MVIVSILCINSLCKSAGGKHFPNIQRGAIYCDLSDCRRACQEQHHTWLVDVSIYILPRNKEICRIGIKYDIFTCGNDVVAHLFDIP